MNVHKCLAIVMCVGSMALSTPTFADSVCVQNSAGAPDQVTSPFSITATIGGAALPSGVKFETIFSKYSSTKNQRSMAFGLNRLGKLELVYSKDGTGATALALQSLNPVPNAFQGKLTSVGVRVKRGEYHFFANGLSIGGGTLPGVLPIAQSSAHYYVGCVERSTNAPDLVFNGTLSDVQYYNYALSLDEAAAIAARTVPKMTPTPVTTPKASAGGGLNRMWSPIIRSSAGVDYASLRKGFGDVKVSTWQVLSSAKFAWQETNDIASLPTMLQNVVPNVNALAYTIPGYGLRKGQGMSTGADVAGTASRVAEVAVQAQAAPGALSVTLDDYFSTLDASAHTNLSTSSMSQICRAASSQKSRLNMDVVLYCNHPLNAMQASNMSSLSKAKTEDGAFADWYKKDATLQSCVDGVQLFLAPDQWKSSQYDDAAQLSQCIANFKGTNLQVSVGVYILPLSSRDVTVSQATHNVNAAYYADSSKSGISFFYLPLYWTMTGVLQQKAQCVYGMLSGINVSCSAK